MDQTRELLINRVHKYLDEFDIRSDINTINKSERKILHLKMRANELLKRVNKANKYPDKISDKDRNYLTMDINKFRYTTL